MKIGFIGIGNMGGAILKGYILANQKKAEDVFAFDADGEKLQRLSGQLHFHPCGSIEELVGLCDVTVLAVKPNIYDVILPHVKKAMTKEKVILSVAAGISMDYIEQAVGIGTKIVRIMPNTPALVQEGMTAVFHNQHVSHEELSCIMEIIESIGKAKSLDESLIHTVIGVSGSSPAYVYMFIDALIEGAVKNGMDRELAKTFAAQSVLGAAKMVLETGEAPSKLRDDVCSPGGTTIEAVYQLQDNGFCQNVISGMEAAIEKSKKMTK
ncbi:MAG: pyrroline-5-carboxylate reductase [Anaerovorax sp.]